MLLMRGKVLTVCNFREAEYGEYGKCICLSNGIYDIFATLERGPRIIRFGFTGGENEFCELGIKKPDDSELDSFRVFGNMGIWQNCGGHRLWTAEEAMPRTYFPDNHPVSCDIVGNTVTLTAGIQPWTQIEAVISLSLENDHVLIQHKIINHGAWDITLAPWALTVMAPGGLEVIPQRTDDTVYQHNRVLTFWPYTKMNDQRVYFGERFITLTQDKQWGNPFKIGYNNQSGKAFYFNHGNLFIKEFDVIKGANYPDGGVTYETYTNSEFLEMESLGVYSVIKPEKEVSHTERWRLVKNISRPDPDSEDEIFKILKKYL